MGWRSPQVRDTLERKGFVQSNTGDAYFRLFVDGKFTGVKTKVSHGREDIVRGRFLFTQMKRQMHLTSEELERFFNCPMTGEDYIALLRSKGIIK